MNHRRNLQIVYAAIALAFLPVLRGLLHATDATVPFAIDWDKAAESAVDLSSFLDAPAGKDGFIRVEKDHLVRPDGKRFRIWGVNLTGPNCFPAKEDAPLIAADLARYGVNCVRFHHMDSRRAGFFDPARDDTRRLDPEKLDRLDFFVAELKKRGIYTNLNLNVSRQYKKGDGVRDYHLLGYGKGATYFNERLIELQHEYARQLLTHRNPYTGSDYCNEPAVLCVEMVNENSLVEAWISGRLAGKDDPKGDASWGPLPVSYANELTEQYNAWLAKNIAPDVLARIRESAGVKEGQPVPRLNGRAEMAKASRERFFAEARFIMEKEQLFFDGMKKLLREELGVKSLLVGSSDHNDSISGYPHILANMTFDIIDGHGYWEHPRTRPSFWLKNTAMVNDPFDCTVIQFARTPVVGRPFTISEVNHPFPNEYACEGIPILTAYTLFHDWDGIYWFTFGAPREAARTQQGLATFDFSNDPVKLSQLAVCGLMFHRQDLAAAKRMIVRAYTPDDLIESIRMPQAERPFFTKGFSRTTPLQYAVRLSFGGQSTLPFPEHTSGPVIRADSGQIAWYNDEQKKGLVTVDSAKTQVLVGFVKHRRISVTHLAAEVDNDFCALVLTSLDGKPIAQSSQLVLSAGAKVANSGMTWSDDRHTLPEWGKWPPIIEPVTGAVILRGLEGAKSVTVQPLAAEGRPLGETRAAGRSGANWRIPVGNPPTVWYAVRVDR